LLAKKFTVVCADLRGYGDSSKPKCAADWANYSFRAMAADQVALMNKLGFERFHAIGHDRGGRTCHRMALDRPDAVISLAVVDIVPTYAMFMDTNRHVAGAYWHWYFLALPEPFPERLIGHEANYFYETCLVGWGATAQPRTTAPPPPSISNTMAPISTRRCNARRSPSGDRRP
jgi:haloacetate dehalogenase